MLGDVCWLGRCVKAAEEESKSQKQSRVQVPSLGSPSPRSCVLYRGMLTAVVMTERRRGVRGQGGASGGLYVYCVK